MDEKLHAWVQELLPAGETLASLEKLFGEASYREYFRVFLNDRKTYVLMKMPPGKQSVSEEITNYEGPKKEIPFLNVARYLAECNLPAPRVLASHPEHGLILLQDLGDKTLEKLLQNCNEEMRVFFYKQAVDLLLQFQKAGLEHPDKECMAFHRSFDATLLQWELDHFLEYGIEDRFKIKVPDSQRQRFHELGKSLVHSILQIPYGLTHRDFQSRNLMLYGYEFHMLDFQDALLGPPQYDLVALLRDSYIDLPFPLVEALIDYYLSGREKAGLPELNPAEFRKNFHRITLQRKLKDAGRFQFIKTVKGNPNFLPHVGTSLAYVRSAFQALPEYEELHQLIAEFVPEIK